MANLLLLLLVATAAVTASSIRPALLPRGKAKSVPAFPFDPDTAKYCVWWFDNEDTTPPWTCEEIETLHGVSLQDFVYWNPSLNAEACQMHANQSYCISALDEQHLGPGAGSPSVPEPATVTVISTSILEAPAPPPVTVTVISTDIHTLEPPAPVTVTVVSTEAAPAPTPLTVTAVSISIRTVLETLTLAPVTLPPTTVTAISTQVTTLPARRTSVPITVPTTVTQTVQVPTTRTSTVVSVSVSVSVSASRTTVTATRTTTATVISTTMAVKTAIVTATVTQKITVQVQIPPTTCIQPPPTKPTNNGINTPSPTQDGLTSNCKTFYFVQPGDSCQKIADRFGIPTDRFISWNQGAKKDCSTLWAGTWACVAVL